MYHKYAYWFMKINKTQILPNKQVQRLTWTKGCSGICQCIYHPQKNLPWQERQAFSPLCSVFNNLYHDFVVRQHICVHVHIYCFLLTYIVIPHINMHSTWVSVVRGQKRHQIPRNWSYNWLQIEKCGYWERNSGLLHDQEELLAPEPSLRCCAFHHMNVCVWSIWKTNPSLKGAIYYFQSLYIVILDEDY